MPPPPPKENMVQPTLMGWEGGLTINLCDKAVQNMFYCAFPIFWSIFQKLWIFHQEKFLLGRRKLRRPRWNLVLGTGIFSDPKKGIVLGRRKLRRPRKKLFRRHIQSFWKRSLKIGNAQLNVFCTALLPNIALTQLQINLFLVGEHCTA